jgi:hypothetical protein
MFGIRDPGSGKNSSRIPDPWGKKVPDPGSRIRIRNTGYNCIILVFSDGLKKLPVVHLARFRI